MAGPRPRVEELIAALAERLGTSSFVSVCTDLLGGAPRERYAEELPWLTGHDLGARAVVGEGLLDTRRWGDFWVRSWGARGLLHVWHDSASTAIADGLADEHHRPGEMCLKVVTRHDVAGTGDGAARWATHELARVRAHAMRALAVVGDTEHEPVVLAALDDAHPDVRRQAERARVALAARLDH